MSGDTVTLALEGEVALDTYALLIQRFSELLARLSADVATSTAIAWWIDDLQFGSAMITARGEAAEVEPVHRVVEAYAVVGRALEKHAEIPYSPQVVQSAKSMVSLIGSKITSLRFETKDAEALITAPADTAAVLAPRTAAYGMIEGRVETLTRRHTLRFTLYDVFYDRAVSCFLEQGQEELMRDAWGKRCLVEGIIIRERQTGRPIAIRKVSHLEVLGEPAPGEYQRARAVIPFSADDPLPEEIIRGLRDAQ